MADLLHGTSGLGHCTVSMPAGNDILAIDTRSSSSFQAALSCLFLAVIVDPFEVEGVDMAGNVSVD